MSLAKLRLLTEDGVCFRSHIDGSKHRLTPERAIEIQLQLNSDILMSFDECTPYPCSFIEAKKSMDLSMRWASRSKEAFGEQESKALFGIVQGSTFEHLREESAEILTGIGFNGYAVGGLAVGEGQEKMLGVLDYLPDMLPSDSPRYLMGVGKPSDLVESVRRGIDMFDCVLPTRSGRTGQALTRMGPINIRNSRHSKDPRPLDFNCDCYTCTHYSRGYLHHVNKSKEIISSVLLTWHNLHYYQKLMDQIRTAVYNKKFKEFSVQFYEILSNGDYDPI
jgi:queuine tRNA-ribosyltransferase